MKQSRLLKPALALAFVTSLGACAVAPPYGGPPYDSPPVVIGAPCYDYVLGCDGPDHGRPHGPDRGRPDPDRSGHGPDHGPGQVKPPAPRPEPPAPRPVHREEEDKQVKH